VLDRVLVEAVLEGVGAVEVSPAVQPYLEGAYEARKVAIGRDGVICHLREVSGSTPKPGTGPRTLATYTSPRASAVRLSADVMRPMKGDAIATFAQPRLLDRHAQALVGAGLRELALTLSGYGMESICFGTPTGWGRLPHLYGIGRRARWRDKRPPSRLIAALDPEVRVYPLDGGSNVITNKRLVTRNLAAVALERSLAGTPDRFRLAKAKVHLDGDRLVLGMPQYVVSPPREERERLLGGALLMARTLGRDRLSFDHLVLGQRNNVADVADWKALVASLGAESNHYGYLSVDVNQGLERLEAVSTGVEAGRSLGDGF
jgi:hypothetical protein